MQPLSLEQSNNLIKNGELSTDIIGSNDTVAVIFSQSWCPQWQSMKSYLTELDDKNIYFYIYDTAENFDAFMNFKENVFRNDEVPYVRFYRKGQLTSECNYIGREEFKKRIE